MSSQRAALSADAREDRLPRRNVAAGKRLAPLPPGLRGRVRGGATDASSSSSTAAALGQHRSTDLAHTAPQQPRGASSHARGTTAPPAASSPSSSLANASASPPLTEARGGAGKSATAQPAGSHGRRHLPPVARDERGGPSPPPLPASTAAAASRALAALNNARGAAAGSVPADATHTRRGSNVSTERDGTGYSHASAAPPRAAGHVRSGGTPRATTPDGARRRSSGASSTALADTSPQRRGGQQRTAVPRGTAAEHSPRSAASTQSNGSLSARKPAATNGSARPHHHKQQRPPLLTRPPARVIGSGTTGLAARAALAEQSTSRTGGGHASSNSGGSGSHVSSTASIAAALRNPVRGGGPSPAAAAFPPPASTRSLRSNVGGATGFGSPLARNTAERNASSVEEQNHRGSIAEEEKEEGEGTKRKAELSAAAPLTYAPHDMDETFYQNTAEWKTGEELPGLVMSLLEGEALEAPHTTYLWTQAYAKPGELQPQSSSGTAPPAYSAYAHSEHGRDGSGRGEDGSDLPLSWRHLDPAKRTDGFYSCVRCGTPVCSPRHQVIPAASALRGIAVFNRLHLHGVDLRVRTAATSSTTIGARSGAAGGGGGGGGSGGFSKAPRAGRLSFAAPPLSYRPGVRVNPAEAFLQASGTVQFVAHCRNCGGCLGAMFIGEVVVDAPSSAVHPSSPTPSSLAEGAQVGRHAPLGNARDAPQVAVVAQELLCVNSACLRYEHFKTRAALDGELLGGTDAAHGGAAASGFSFFSAEAAAGGSNAKSKSGGRRGVTMGALFGPERQTAWSLQDDNDDEGDNDDSSSAAADGFDALLDALNPYTGGDGGSDSDDY